MRFLIKPDEAIKHIGWGISGDFDDNGTTRQPQHGIFSWVVSKQNSKWLLTAVQNTNIKDKDIRVQQYGTY